MSEKFKPLSPSHSMMGSKLSSPPSAKQEEGLPHDPGLEQFKPVSSAKPIVHPCNVVWSSENPSDITNVKQHENKTFKDTNLYPDVKENCMSTAFSHIFQGGYSAGYYSYKWAEVLDADAFEYFSKNGIFNKEIGTKFKEHILSKGGSEHPMELYKKFRGQEPDNEALLRRSGLLQ